MDGWNQQSLFTRNSKLAPAVISGNGNPSQFRMLKLTVVFAFFLSASVFAEDIAVGMDELTLLALKGQPTTKLIGPKRAVYKWPDLEAVLVEGKISTLHLITVAANMPAGKAEYDFMFKLEELNTQTMDAISRDKYDEIVREMFGLMRSLHDDFKNKQTVEESGRFLQAHEMARRIWHSERRDIFGRTNLSVDMISDPDACRLLAVIPVERRRGITIVGNGYVIRDISTVINYVNDQCWARLLAVYRQNSAIHPLPPEPEKSSAAQVKDNSDNRDLSSVSAAKLVGGAKVQVSAKVLWARTGVMVSPGDRYSINYSSGSWSPNPQLGRGFDGNGHTQINSGATYLAPGYAEGSLVGKIGNGKPFYIGNRGTTPADSEGELMLSINDDPVGYGDNSGAIFVEIRRQN